MSMYSESLNGARRSAVENALFELDCAKLDMLYEAVESEYQFNIKAADTKVFVESGSNEDLVDLYIEAETEASGKKKNIILRIIDRILKVINDIKKAIRKKFGRGDNIPEEATVSNIFVKMFEAIKKLGKAIVRPITLIKSGQISKMNPGEIIKACAPILATFAVASVAAGGVVKIKKSKAKEIIKAANSVNDQSEDGVNAAKDAVNNSSMSTEDQNKVKEVLSGVFQPITSKLKEFINKFLDALKKGKVGGAVNKLGNRFKRNRSGGTAGTSEINQVLALPAPAPYEDPGEDPGVEEDDAEDNDVTESVFNIIDDDMYMYY